MSRDLLSTWELLGLVHQNTPAKYPSPLTPTWPANARHKSGERAFRADMTLMRSWPLGS